MILYTHNKQKVFVNDKPINGGGQGKIHLVGSSPYDFVVKIFTRPTDSLRQRIEYMSKNNPFIYCDSYIREAFAWPLEPVYDNSGSFKGFMMKYVPDSIKLFELTLSQSKKFKSNKWKKFDISNPDSYVQRIKILYNISKALEVLDKYGKYRVVDLKPANIMLRNNGHIVIIDCDSIQIEEKGTLLHSAEVATEEYCPPEYFNSNIDYRSNIIKSSWDYFSFGVISYQVLLCLHPFNASHNTYNTIPELIKNDLFVHGHKAHQLHLIPPPHQNYTQILGPSVRNNFNKCFIDGYNNPSQRPNFYDWSNVLLNEININKATKKTLKPKLIPIIHYFEIKPSSMPNAAVLQWNVSNANSVTINGNKVNPIGTMVTQVRNCIHTIVAEHSGSLVTKKVTLSLPRIIDFSCNVSNGYLTYNWKVSGANTIRINDDTVSLAGIKHGPLKLGKQTLKAENTAGFIVTKDLFISCLSIIKEYQYLPSKTSCLIKWDVWNAYNVNINGINVSKKGNLKVSLEKKQYNLTAIDNAGNIVSNTILVDCPPKVKTFDIVRNSHTATLVWDIWYAKECSINNKKAPNKGEIIIPLLTQKYTLEILDYNGVRSVYSKNLNAPTNIPLKPILPTVHFKPISSNNTIITKACTDITKTTRSLFKPLDIQRFSANNKNKISTMLKPLKLITKSCISSPIINIITPIKKNSKKIRQKNNIDLRMLLFR